MLGKTYNPIKESFEYKNNSELIKSVDRNIRIDAEEQTNKTFR
jgi:hypothetical protein